MDGEVLQPIPLVRLAVAFVPVAIVLVIWNRWALGIGSPLYALARMLGQLLLVGFFLAWIFDSDQAWTTVGVLAIMVFASSWIALRTIPQRRRRLLQEALLAVVVGGGVTLALITQGVLALDPWSKPSVLLPLAGMIFASAMNSISIAAERFYAERERGLAKREARNIAFRGAMIPVVNALFAVGLVSIPGMMTGQILAGVSPLIAARYQIMVMCMIFGASGISAAIFLTRSRD